MYLRIPSIAIQNCSFNNLFVSITVGLCEYQKQGILFCIEVLSFRAEFETANLLQKQRKDKVHLAERVKNCRS